MPLVFPGMNRKKGEPPEDPFERVFRDGKRSLPPHLADLMSDLDTTRYTFEDAVAKVNNRLARDHANDMAGKLIREHFAGHGDGS